ncbi:hypothetical protein [Flavobacterium akiainvivens]|uniref:hypothetical protein n=1 Tax=Flavobacterium akiainvivens TaxID=1202724 RepID=UPI0008DF1009|nr:hypothetical protein [Flavobacterium akiainvivens]SFQ59142.1 hypothetical protein SAMN05444144_10980 [Flavobacterium akiainvivens]
MAKPIKITPVLRGADAVDFLKKLDENKQKKVSGDYLSAIRNSAKQLESIFKRK